MKGAVAVDIGEGGSCGSLLMKEGAVAVDTIPARMGCLPSPKNVSD